MTSPQPGLVSLPSQLQGSFASPVSPHLCSILRLLQCSQVADSFVLFQLPAETLVRGLFHRCPGHCCWPLSAWLSSEWYWEHLPWKTLGGQDWGSRAWTDLWTGALLLLPAPFEDMAWGLGCGYVQRAPEGATLTMQVQL